MDMSTFGQRITANISERLADKLHNQVGYRADLYVSDFSPINKTTAKVLVGYNSRLGKPDVSQIETFMLKHFNGSVVADTTTCRNYVGLNVISCVVGFPKQHISLQNKPEHFQALAGDVAFLDTKLGHVWGVEGNGEEKYLTRQFKDNISDILAARQRAMMTHAGTVKFTDLPNEGEVSVAEGYKVTVYHNDSQKTGVVASVQPSCIRVRLEDGKVVTASPKAILDVVQVDAASEAASNQALRDYYLQFMSKELVDQLYPEGGGKPKFDSNKSKGAR